MITALLIEDDTNIAELLVRFLESNNIAVHHEIKPSAAQNYLKHESVDVIILDLSLPEMDGLELCKKLKTYVAAPIIISSARSDITDKLQALDDGADDYLPKPYDPRELLARIKTVLKRYGKVADENSSFVIDDVGTRILFQGRELELTPAEYQILKLFIERAGQTIERSDLANSIDSHRFDSGIESINVLIGRLRKKIEPDTTKPTYIKTVRGIGYRFAYL